MSYADHPAGHGAWVRRRGGRTATEVPNAVRARVEQRPGTPSRVVVVLHVFSRRFVAEVVARLAAIPVPFDLIVTKVDGERAVGVGRMELPMLRHVTEVDVDERGRDVWPLLQLVNAGLLDPYEVVLKVCTRDGVDDRVSQSVSAVLRDRSGISAILGAFGADHDLGVVTASTEDGELGGLAAELLRRLNVEAAATAPALGPVFWARGFVVQGLRSLALCAEDFAGERAAEAVAQVIGFLTGEAGLRVATPEVLPAREAPRRFHPDGPRDRRARVVPFYLPQFHPIEENDTWWGRGFTEWTNVTAAAPVYSGHNQPNLPSELGFYDLRLDEVREAQAELAGEHGVHAFMYYYYWFDGRKLLETPIEKHAASDLDMPFCVMWANENWTRRWDGLDSSVLIEQSYVGVEKSIEDLLPLLTDPRYLRVDDRPVLAIYRVGLLPDPAGTFAQWRRRAQEAGLPGLCLLAADVGAEFDGVTGDLDALGLDGTIGFPPHKFNNHRRLAQGVEPDERFTGVLLDYRTLAHGAAEEVGEQPDTAHPGVLVNFDNTARVQWRSLVTVGSNPYTFRRWLGAAIDAVARRSPDHRVVFVNAWNEWAEGAVLEPTQRFGRTYLLAVRDAVLS